MNPISGHQNRYITEGGKMMLSADRILQLGLTGNISSSCTDGTKLVQEGEGETAKRHSSLLTPL